MTPNPSPAVLLEVAHPTAALRNLRIGVAMDLQYLRDGEAKLSALDAAIAALDHPQQPSGWLPIASAPEGTMILCANMKAKEARDWAFVAWMAGGKVCGYYRMDMPTHWQQLPAAPTHSAEQQSSVVRLSQGDAFPIGCDINQHVTVAAAGTDKVAPAIVDLGGDGLKHNVQPAGAASPHDGNLPKSAHQHSTAEQQEGGEGGRNVG